jgi:hypothetical protein
MKYADEMGSGAMIYEYIPSFIKTDSAIQQLIGGRYTVTQIQISWGSHKHTFIFSK